MQTFRLRLVSALCSAGQSNARRDSRTLACGIAVKNAPHTRRLPRVVAQVPQLAGVDACFTGVDVEKFSLHRR